MTDRAQEQLAALYERHAGDPQLRQLLGVYMDVLRAEQRLTQFTEQMGDAQVAKLMRKREASTVTQAALHVLAIVMARKAQQQGN